MVQENQMLSMHFYLYLAIEQAKWDNLNYQILSIRQEDTKIWIPVLLKYILKKSLTW